ncbi:hypothetical protein NLI96_g5126 [Meripilus lineatus]|uniref:Glucose-methanol-choline oxidoreductase N-terminal domain-containing protein n=1 Tax=Meripilus lineatus TaxID=2056292 RepID=A0AAD5YJA0_9APHY|nr:hypothetical protein NLI96_g5126 [Physisporinus lineatus]
MLATIEELAGKSFDYIVVGGGTSGLTLAARISENPKLSVLVLESGGANIDDPAIREQNCKTMGKVNSDYRFHPSLASHIPNRGKGLGGSSAINFMCWTKPPSQEIDDFERLGNPGWNWKRYNEALQRTEGFVPPPLEAQKRNNMNFDAWEIGREGPLTIAYPATINPVETKVQQTFINAGIPIASRPLSGDPKGVFLAPVTCNPVTHTRTYSTTAFYLPNKERPNLTVLLNANCERIVTEELSDGGLKATGVEFSHHGKKYFVQSAKEVVLSAGALKSPQVLELSGIGNKEILERAHIPLKLDLPGVGKNVQEHIYAALSFELRDDVEYDTLDLLKDPKVAAKHLELHASGSGIFTMGIIGFAFASLQMLSSKTEEIYERTKEAISKKMASLPLGLQEQYKIQLERLRTAPGCEIISIPGGLSSPNPHEDGKRYISIFSAANHMFSRGTIHSTSNNPDIDPEFDPHYFEEDVDLQMLVEMVKFIRNLTHVSPLKDLITKELNPGPAVQSDDELRGEFNSRSWLYSVFFIFTYRMDNQDLQFDMAHHWIVFHASGG